MIFLRHDVLPTRTKNISTRASEIVSIGGPREARGGHSTKAYHSLVFTPKGLLLVPHSFESEQNEHLIHPFEFCETPVESCEGGYVTPRYSQLRERFRRQ